MSTPQTPQPEQQQVAPGAPAAAPFEYAAASQAAAEAPKKGMGKKILGIVAVVVIGVAVKFGIGAVFGDDPVRAKAGDCAVVSGTDSKPEFKVVGCDDASANATVSRVVENSFDLDACGDGVAAIAQQKGSEKFVLCLTLKQ
ncbi:hypothetical protein HUT16_18775 [Kitasatospora sp. NA04385]|uniref:LppU/SCO3897 family protein n=1 Tax=Kitasatospora sp. NA04385 TaxID=2742135 RepID=UPI001590C21C|nr:hypothetical protein [Kitasatospora sp. NA04385]QKW20835.1 hypothetical protein HUT16_18775 [Kitasatospora sp. NA04385]